MQLCEVGIDGRGVSVPTVSGAGGGQPVLPADCSAQEKLERPVGRSSLRCWLQTAKIPSLFVRSDAEHQQFVDVLLGLADQLPQLGDFPT